MRKVFFLKIGPVDFFFSGHILRKKNVYRVSQKSFAIFFFKLQPNFFIAFLICPYILRIFHVAYAIPKSKPFGIFLN